MGILNEGGTFSFSAALDPYVSIECEGVTVKTTVKSNTESAKYEEGGLFYVKKPQTSMLKLKVCTYFRAFSLVFLELFF